MCSFRAATKSSSSAVEFMYIHTHTVNGDLPGTSAMEYYSPVSDGYSYRWARTEDDDDEVISSVVSLDVNSRKIFGRINYFVHCAYDNIDYELSYVDWLGYGQRYEHTEMFEVKPQTVPGMNNFAAVESLSPPLLHAWEGDTLWMPCCF